MPVDGPDHAARPRHEKPVELGHVHVVNPARGLKMLLHFNNGELELPEVFARLQIRVCFRKNVYPARQLVHPALGLAALTHTHPLAQLDDLGEKFGFVLGVALCRVQHLRQRVVTLRQRHADVGIGFPYLKEYATKGRSLTRANSLRNPGSAAA